MVYKVIGTGSKGNAILYHDSILVDCGVPFNKVRDDLYSIQIILLTHQHGDHINLSTIKKLMFERPSLRIGCCEWMLPFLEGIRDVDVYKPNVRYDYGSFSLMPFKLFHDVPNCGYRIFKDDHKIFHATDTSHLEGISAPNYDLYAVECNYDEDMATASIIDKSANGDYSHERGSFNSHLSEGQARDFIDDNRKISSDVLKLHATSSYL